MATLTRQNSEPGIFVPTVVLDPGSYTFKAGMAGEEIPSIISPSFIGRSNSEEDWALLSQEKLQSFYSSQYEISEPLIGSRQGVIENWDCIERIVQALPTELGFCYSDTPVVVTEPINVVRSYRLSLIKRKRRVKKKRKETIVYGEGCYLKRWILSFYSKHSL